MLYDMMLVSVAVKCRQVTCNFFFQVSDIFMTKSFWIPSVPFMGEALLLLPSSLRCDGLFNL